jgi:hypothetical protein
MGMDMGMGGGQTSPCGFTLLVVAAAIEVLVVCLVCAHHLHGSKVVDKHGHGDGTLMLATEGGAGSAGWMKGLKTAMVTAMTGVVGIDPIVAG